MFMILVDCRFLVYLVIIIVKFFFFWKWCNKHGPVYGKSVSNITCISICISVLNGNILNIIECLGKIILKKNTYFFVVAFYRK